MFFVFHILPVVPGVMALGANSNGQHRVPDFYCKH